MPPRILTTVLLPAPFSPASEWTRPACRSRSTSASTRTGPNRLVIARNSTSGLTPHSPPARCHGLGRNTPSARRRCAGAARLLAAAPASGRKLVRVLLVVRLGVLQRIAGDDLAVVPDRIGARPLVAGLDREGIARLAFDLAFREQLGGVVRDVAELDRVPQVEDLDRTVEHVLRGDAG